MSAYALVKVLHVVAVIVWAGATVAWAFGLGAGARDAAPAAPAGVPGRDVALKRRVLAIGMLAAFGAGLVLAQQGGWLSQGWMQAKLVVAVALAGVHGTLVGRLRRRAVAASADGGGTGSAGANGALPWIALALVVAAVSLVILKPVLGG